MIKKKFIRKAREKMIKKTTKTILLMDMSKLKDKNIKVIIEK